MKKKPEKTWYLDSGFELRKQPNGYWSIMESGKAISENHNSSQDAAYCAQILRKSRNEQVQSS